MLYQKKLQQAAFFDILVAGGGPAGCAAAAAAAREGKSVLLVEGTGCLGGMGTAGLVPAWCPFTDKEKLIYRGLAQRVFEKSSAMIPHAAHRKDWFDWVPIDAESLKRVYDELVREYGVTVLFYTQIVDTISADGLVSGVVAAGKNGLTLYTADVFVDCTGDADIAVAAGAPCHQGDDQGRIQPATLCFTLTNVDEYAYLNGEELHPNNPDSPIYRIVNDGKYPVIPDTHLCHTLIGPRTVGFNAGHLWGVDNTNPSSVSSAQMEGRRMAKAFRDALAEYVPAAFANAHLVQTAALPGIRETRRIEGLYVLTREDYLARRTFSDEIGRNCYYLDVHHNKAQANNASKQSTARELHTHRYLPGESHGIPYRCLVPKHTRNVLAAGRCISTDRPVQGSVRVMPVCLVTGEAAGVAAALALDTANGVPADVDTDALRSKLAGYGAYFL